jgi:glycosyltransferase involved in cell wall biosynthesis
MTTDAVSGVWNYSLELARALRPRGIEVCLACLGPSPTPRQRLEASAIGNVEFHERSFALEWMPEPWAEVAKAGEWLLELEDAFEPDVIHLNHYANATLPWNAPVLVTAHGDRISWWRAVYGGEPPAEWNRYRTEIAAGLRSADLIVTPTRAGLDALTDLGLREGTPASLPRVIPHARSSALFPARAKREFILSAGRAWDGAKNMAMLENAAADLPWPVFMAGSTVDLNGNSVEFRNVDCLGPLVSADLANWMGLASIFVLPSRYEPSGLAALEAALAGCALVLSDIPSLREIWCDMAFFVPPDDPRALAATLRRLIKDAPFRNQLGSHARRRALERTPEQMGESYLECYRELLARNTAHALDLKTPSTSR